MGELIGTDGAGTWYRFPAGYWVPGPDGAPLDLDFAPVITLNSTPEEAPKMGNVQVKVADGTQVNVDGTVYAEGETVSVDHETAQQWIAAGWVTPAGRKSGAKASTAT